MRTKPLKKLSGPITGSRGTEVASVYETGEEEYETETEMIDEEYRRILHEETQDIDELMAKTMQPCNHVGGRGDTRRGSRV
jgi:hypothetical protein